LGQKLINRICLLIFGTVAFAAPVNHQMVEENTLALDLSLSTPQK
jgi:hypothetical protein